MLPAPMVRAVPEVIAQCRAADTPLSMCGEYADPIEAMVLIARFPHASLTATAVGRSRR